MNRKTIRCPRKDNDWRGNLISDQTAVFVVFIIIDYRLWVIFLSAIWTKASRFDLWQDFYFGVSITKVGRPHPFHPGLTWLLACDASQRLGFYLRPQRSLLSASCPFLWTLQACGPHRFGRFWPDSWQKRDQRLSLRGCQRGKLRESWTLGSARSEQGRDAVRFHLASSSSFASYLPSFWRT